MKCPDCSLNIDSKNGICSFCGYTPNKKSQDPEFTEQVFCPHCKKAQSDDYDYIEGVHICEFCKNTFIVEIRKKLTYTTYKNYEG